MPQQFKYSKSLAETRQEKFKNESQDFIVAVIYNHETGFESQDS